MESKLLNFPEAMRLAQIVSKYIDTESIQEMTGEEFFGLLFSSLTDDEAIELGVLCTTGMNKKLSMEKRMINMMLENKILALLLDFDKIFGSKK